MQSDKFARNEQSSKREKRGEKRKRKRRKREEKRKRKRVVCDGKIVVSASGSSTASSK
jgi:hypothetical protein